VFLLLNSSASSESTTVTVNSIQLVCNVSTVYRQQRPDQLLNYKECRRHASMLENGQWITRICACQVYCHACIRHRLTVVCADALKSLSTAAELAGV